MSDWTSIALSVGFMAGLGLLLATILVFANRRLYVYEDPRIDEVEELLPHANCGACGSAGCRTFAEGLIDGEFEPSQCTVNPDDLNQAIADYLGVGLGNQEQRVARLACAGGTHVAYIRASYDGLDSCRAAALVSGGGKGCAWGCLGMGDCAVVCDFDAITLDRERLDAVVTLKIRKQIILTDDVIASIKTAGLIGDKYIKLSPGGSDEQLKPGDFITETESALDLEELISKYVFGKV